jgi:eukaryotic-like serine/threonine-protein kinase
MERAHSHKIGRFQIASQLGRGGQGTVYLAKDPYLERPVAIKVLRVKSGKTLYDNFLKEARTVSKLNHPNIIPIFEAGEQKGIPYLVFEFVAGISLKDAIEKKKPLSVTHAVAFMRQILRGVGYAHKKGIIHLDLKPGNILISKSGVPRVMDFGISMMMGSDNGRGQNLRGTRRYMSPEHFSEKPLGPYTDVFALGLIFFEMLTRTPAFTGKNQFNAIYKIINEPTVAPSVLNSKVDDDLDSIVLKAVQKESNARFPDAISMKKALDEYVDRIKRGSLAPSVSDNTHSTVDFLLRRIKYKADFPAFSKCVMEINRMTSSESKASARQLANVILSDYSLTNKLLKLVNSAFYGQSGGSITSIYKAVVLLGFEQVRLAASSLMLFNHLQGKSATKELRDGMIKSFMSGIIARDLTKRSKLRRTELAFICSLFHDLGKNLTIYYFPEEYAEIKKVMGGNGNDLQGAARTVLGISLDELGVGIARAWKFPENIVYSMRGLPGGPVEPPDSTLDNIRHFSVFANELCRIAECDHADIGCANSGGANSGGAENRGEPLSRLVQRFEQSFPITETEVLTLLRFEINMVKKYASILNIVPEQSPFIQNLIKFAGTGEGAIDSATPKEGQASQSSESGPVKDSPAKGGAMDVKRGVRKRDAGSPSNPTPVAPSKSIWQKFLRFLHRLGF